MKKGDRYVINGSKTFITNAPVADVFVVFANVDRSKKHEGITAFIIEKGTPGLIDRQALPQDGMQVLFNLRGLFRGL